MGRNVRDGDERATDDDAAGGVRRRVPVAGPWVTQREVDAVAHAAEHDWYGGAGQSTGRFEAAFAEYVGVRHAAAVPHCTAALHLGLVALGVGEGDEVIVPESTWVATAAPIFYVGATPVFADIDPTSWCITAESIEECTTARTKAVITVDLYGGVPDMDAVRAVTDRHDVPILEDAAQSIGSRWRGRSAGALGDVATFSFHGTKTLTTGEGGMIVTDRDDLHQRILSLRDHGRTPLDHRYFVTNEIAYKYKMSSLQAAFGLAQLERIDELLDRKRQIFGWYRDRLGDTKGLQLNAEVPDTTNTFWMVTVVLDESHGWQTRELMAAFDGCDIDTRPFFPPLSSLPALAHVPGAVEAKERNVVAYDLAERAINLPSALMLTEGDVDRVCVALRQLLGDR